MPTITFPTFPALDLTKLDLTKLDLGKLESVLPTIDTDAVTGAAKDVAYVAIGFGVLAVQKAQSARRDVVKVLTDQFDGGRKHVRDLFSAAAG